MLKSVTFRMNTTLNEKVDFLGLHCDHLWREEMQYTKKHTGWQWLSISFTLPPHCVTENNRSIKSIIWRDEPLQEETEVIDKFLMNFEQNYIHTRPKKSIQATLCFPETISGQNHCCTFWPIKSPSSCRKSPKTRIQIDFDDLSQQKTWEKVFGIFPLACDILQLSHEVQPISKKDQSSHCQASTLIKWPENWKISAETAKKQRRISWCSIRSTWPLTINHQVIQTHQGTCKPYRWWYCRRIWFFRLFSPNLLLTPRRKFWKFFKLVGHGEGLILQAFH